MILIAICGIAFGLFSPAAGAHSAGMAANHAFFHFSIDFSSPALLLILGGMSLLFIALALLSHPAVLRKRNIIHR